MNLTWIVGGSHSGADGATMSKTTNKFSAEVRERSVLLVLDHEKDHPSRRLGMRQ